MSSHVATEALTVHRLGDSLGAEIRGIDLNQPLDEEQVQAVRRAWAEHLVLRFRGQESLTLEAHIAFSRHFGRLDIRPKASMTMSQEYEALPAEITVISNIKVGGQPLGALGDAEAVWHADMTYNDHPPKGACLYAKEVPPTGGNTHFANMYAAYEALDNATKSRIKSLSCIHDASRNSAGELRLGYEDNTDPRKTVGAIHPLVGTHPVTGKPYLMLGRRRNAYIVGLEIDESETLLNRLWAHATQAQFTWAQVWQAGDLVMWDNTCTLHRRDSFDPATRRLMYRTQIGQG